MEQVPSLLIFAMQFKIKITKMEDQQTFTRKRSESLTKDEYKALKAYRKTFDREVDCAISLEMDRNVLSRLLLKGSGSPETIEKVRAGLKTGL